MENKTVRPFGFRDKFGYALGDFGNNFTFLFASMYLLTFCTDVLGVSAAVVGTIMSVSKIIDAFTDFGMGRICDMSKPTKAGRFRPWLKRMAIPMGLSSMMIYQYWVSGFPVGAKIAWVAFFYILWGSFAYTACNIPYGSMASVITNDSKGRAQLSTWRTVGSTLSGMIVGALVPSIIFGTNAQGVQVVVPTKFTTAAIVFGILSAVFYLLCYALTTERVTIDPEKQREAAGKQNGGMGEALKALVTNKPLLILIIETILVLIASLGVQALNTYLFKDYFNNTDFMGIVSIGSTLIMLVMAPVTTILSGKIGKKEVSLVGLGASAVILFVCWIMKVTNPLVYAVFRIAQGAAMGLFSMVSWALISDCIDYEEIRSGVRNDGTTYSAYSFMRKIAQAVGAGLGGFLLSAIGYVSSTSGEAVIQTDAVKSGIFSCMTLLPAVLYALAFLVLFFSPLNKKTVDENARILTERRAKAE